MTAVGTLANIFRVRAGQEFYFKDGNLIWLREVQQHPEFLEIYLKFIRPAILRSAIGSSQKALTILALNKLELKLPSLPEQNKIASFLSSFDKKIDLLRQKKDALELYKKGLMQKIFSQEIRFKQVDGSDFPDWEEVALGELVEKKIIQLGRGKVISKLDLLAFPGTYPVYSSSGAGTGEFGCYGKWMFNEELITWSIDGGGRFFYRSSEKFSITNVSGFLRCLDGSLNYKFLHACLSLQHERLIFDYQIKAHPSVIVKLYNVVVPCLAEQQKIASVLSALDAKVQNTSSQIEQMEIFKKGLLQQMFV